MLRGLHAKVYISQNGWDTTITMGSANATKAALVDGVNVELLVGLTGKTSKVGGIDKIFSQDGFGKLLEPYQPGQPPAEDEAVRLAEMRSWAASRCSMRSRSIYVLPRTCCGQSSSSRDRVEWARAGCSIRQSR